MVSPVIFVISAALFVIYSADSSHRCATCDPAVIFVIHAALFVSLLWFTGHRFDIVELQEIRLRFLWLVLRLLWFCCNLQRTNLTSSSYLRFGCTFCDFCDLRCAFCDFVVIYSTQIWHRWATCDSAVLIVILVNCAALFVVYGAHTRHHHTTCDSAVLLVIGSTFRCASSTFLY